MRTNTDNFDLEAADGEESRGGLFGLALVALAVGAGTALLFAPAEGAKTREAVGERLRDFRGEAESAFGRVQRELHRREAQRRRRRDPAATLGEAPAAEGRRGGGRGPGGAGITGGIAAIDLRGRVGTSRSEGGMPWGMSPSLRSG